MASVHVETLEDVQPSALTKAGTLTLAQEQRRLALVDLREGLIRWPLWLTIGWLEIQQRYRRSIIGPLWITLSIGIFVGGLGIVYSALFKIPIETYLPYLSIGIVIWNFLASLMIEGCTVFIVAEGAIKQNPVPISVHVYRVVFRNLIILAHNALIYFVFLLFFPVKPGLEAFLFPIGLFFASLSGIGMVLVLGVLGTRFRDIPLLVTNLVQVIFFTAPIIWRIETLPADRQWIAQLNPFYHLIEICRAPLLGTVPPLVSYEVAAGFAVVTLAAGIALFTRFSRRLAYWL